MLNCGWERSAADMKICLLILASMSHDIFAYILGSEAPTSAVQEMLGRRLGASRQGTLQLRLARWGRWAEEV